MSTPDLKLVEITDPPVVGNTLYVEKYLGDEAAIYLCIAGTDEDPTTRGRVMELKREAVIQFRDWLSAVLESAAP